MERWKKGGKICFSDSEVTRATRGIKRGAGLREELQCSRTGQLLMPSTVPGETGGLSWEWGLGGFQILRGKDLWFLYNLVSKNQFDFDIISTCSLNFIFLSKKREHTPGLQPVGWHQFGEHQAAVKELNEPKRNYSDHPNQSLLYCWLVSCPIKGPNHIHKLNAI